MKPWQRTLHPEHAASIARLVKREGKPYPYRPSNGTEGDYFQSRWCELCVRDDGADRICNILGNVLFHDVGDAEYPTEWTHDAEGQPMCAAFEEDLTMAQPSPSPEEMVDRVTYHPPTPEARQRHDLVRTAIHLAMHNLVMAVPASRELSLAMTKIEEAMFWANAGIARNHARLEPLPGIPLPEAATAEPEAPKA